jgi:SH3 domain-containing YSC84-like protein 1
MFTTCAIIVSKGRKLMYARLLVATVLGASLLPAASVASKRLDAATVAFKEVMATPDRSIPQDLLERAECVIIVPDVKRAAFVFGAKYGKGFFICRNKSGVGWSAPGAIRIEGANFGLQIGVAETDVFMLIMNDKGMNRLLSTKFTLGGDASAAAGPVGRSTQAETDAAMTAEILTWSRSRGLFAGVSLSGATLREDSDWNQQLYDKKISNREIVNGIDAPQAATALIDELNRYSSRK